MRVPVLVALDPAHVSTGLGDDATASARASAAGPRATRALFQVASSERARYRRRLPPCAIAAAALLPILQVPRRSTRTLLAVNSTVTIIHPSLERSAVYPTLTAYSNEHWHYSTHYFMGHHINFTSTSVFLLLGPGFLTYSRHFSRSALRSSAPPRLV